MLILLKIQTNKETVLSDKFVFSNSEIYCPMSRENLFGHMFSYLFTQDKVTKE